MITNDSNVCQIVEECLVQHCAQTFEIRGIVMQFFTIPGISSNSSSRLDLLYRLEFLPIIMACTRRGIIIGMVVPIHSLPNKACGAVSGALLAGHTLFKKIPNTAQCS